MSEARRVTSQLKNATLRATKALVLNINSDAIGDSPYDLGWFRANWLPGIGRSLPSSPVGSRGAIDTGSQQAAQAKVATQLRFGQDAYIVNSVPYADKLARGHSPQAPAGWVDRIVENNVRRSNSQRLK